MYLLEIMLPNYIRIVEAYIKNKHFNFLTRAVAPNEAHLADAKKALAEGLLVILKRINNKHINNSNQDMHSDLQVVIDGEISGRTSARLSDVENVTRGKSSVNSSDAAARLPTSSVCSSILSFRQRNNTDELRNKGSNSEVSGIVTSNGTFDGVYNTGDTISTYNTIDILSDEINKQIAACEQARVEHGNHKAGSYDAILHTMRDHINFIRMRTQHMLTYYNVHEYSSEDDKAKFKQGEDYVPYRDNLYKLIHAFLCIAAFDKSLVASEIATSPQKRQYALGDNYFLSNNSSVLKDVELKLLSIANQIFSPDFDEVQQFLKTLSDYTLVFLEMKRIPAIAKLFDAQLLELKSDLVQSFEKNYPFTLLRGTTEEQIADYISRRKKHTAFSSALSYFSLDDGLSVASSPYPVIARSPLPVSRI